MRFWIVELGVGMLLFEPLRLVVFVPSSSWEFPMGSTALYQDKNQGKLRELEILLTSTVEA